MVHKLKCHPLHSPVKVAIEVLIKLLHLFPVKGVLSADLVHLVLKKGHVEDKGCVELEIEVALEHREHLQLQVNELLLDHCLDPGVIEAARLCLGLSSGAWRLSSDCVLGKLRRSLLVKLLHLSLLVEVLFALAAGFELFGSGHGFGPGVWGWLGLC